VKPDKSQLENWAQKLGKPVEELEDELNKLKQSNIIMNMPDVQQREQEAMRVLKNRYARSLLLGGVENECQVMISQEVQSDRFRWIARTIRVRKNPVMF
jgi:hypothetical protein